VATVALDADEEQLKVYVDGKLAGSHGDLHPLTIVGLTDQATVAGLEVAPRFELGASTPVTDDDMATDGEPFLGSLDEVAVYARALDPSEVAEHYDAASGR
jgi:hypothetical protein